MIERSSKWLAGECNSVPDSRGCQTFGFVTGRQFIDELINVTLHHDWQIVGGKVDAVIGDSRLGIIVGADLF
jgi:hypothetical protein